MYFRWNIEGESNNKENNKQMDKTTEKNDTKKAVLDNESSIKNVIPVKYVTQFYIHVSVVHIMFLFNFILLLFVEL
jgi:hypothetical protein